MTLWEVASSKERGTLGKPAVAPRRPYGGRMTAGSVGLVFSPDGRALVTRGDDGSVHIWDVDAGKEIGQLKGHDGRIETLAFASDGKPLVSGAADTTILLWDTASALKGMVTAPADELTAAEMESFWNSLAGDDAVKALRGVQKLTAAPRQTVPFLGERLKP